MANEFVAEIEGISKLRKRVDLANLTAKPIRNYMTGAGQILRKKAIQETPKFSGSLANSIHVQRIKSKGRIPNSVKIYSSWRSKDFRKTKTYKALYKIKASLSSY